MHYKLDRGVDHVLIDEAQDTSPRQWDIVADIVSEFTSGQGRATVLSRTIFAVGDEKQSIFSFQGAAPHEFADKPAGLQEEVRGGGLNFDPVSFTYSFRSGVSVLQSVESTFQRPGVYQSITSDLDGMPTHRRSTTPGPA